VTWAWAWPHQPSSALSISSTLSYRVMFSPASDSRIALIVFALGTCGFMGQTPLEETVFSRELSPLIEREPDAAPLVGSIRRSLVSDALPFRGEGEGAARGVPSLSTYFVAMDPSFRPGQLKRTVWSYQYHSASRPRVHAHPMGGLPRSDPEKAPGAVASSRINVMRPDDVAECTYSRFHQLIHLTTERAERREKWDALSMPKSSKGEFGSS
jgi:hypothetical protein